MEKIEEEMWCYNCEHEWLMDDYFNCRECPNCFIAPLRIYRTSSFSFAYAWMEKERLKKEENEKDLSKGLS